VSRYLPRPVVRTLTRVTQRSVMRPWIPAAFQRRWHNAVGRVRAAGLPSEVMVEQLPLGGVPADRIDRPGTDERHAVLYLHGGGYTIGSSVTHRNLAAALCESTRAPVWVPDYRRAPEHPYPAALEDAVAAYRALLEAGHEPSKIALAGESAGAALAVATVLRLRDAGEPLPGALALMCGLYDLRREGPSMKVNRHRDAGLHGGWALTSGGRYAADRDPSLPELSPVEADLAGLPPIHMQVGTDDILLSLSDRFAERAAEAGVEVDYRRYPGMWHAFQLAAGDLREADEAIEDMGEAVRAIWSGRPRENGRPLLADGGRPSRTPKVAIIGAGFGGVGLGIKLKQAGIDFTILEKADGVGGVWRTNTYPGLTCDIPSHLYSFSFEPNPDWSRVYSPQPEILDYIERCVDRYGLEPQIRLGTEVAHADFDEANGRWRVTTTAGEEIEADILVSACGQLSRPAVNRIAGAERFGGPIFHSSRWDHGVDLEGKRVAVIGTGASTIQIVPAIADRVGQLDVYQRSAPFVMPKKDRPYRDWEKRLFRRFPPARLLQRLQQYLYYEFGTAALVQFKSLGRVGARMFERQLAEQVSDPELRSALTPTDTFGCKRLLVSSEYLGTFERPDVELITQGVRELTESGVVAGDGTERPTDVVVLSTGFESTRFLAPMEVRGEDGRELTEAWRGGAEAYLGTTVAGFPNLFIMYGPNTNLGSGSIISVLESQIAYIVDAVRTLERRGGWMSVRPEVQKEFDREIHERLSTSVWMTGCNNWYVDENGRNTNNWPGFATEYRWRTRRLNPADYVFGAPDGAGEADSSPAQSSTLAE
jgi:cation diffusion facilitator CzcD-associated flavoprotein CzcO/acetyl esterase/lipase